MQKTTAKEFALFQGMVIVLCLLYGEVFAAEIDLNSLTHFEFREDARDNDFATLREYIDLNVTNIVDGQLSLYSSGWFRYELESTENGDRENDEILYVYLSYSPFVDRRLIFNLGRQFIFEGIASEQVDGVSARWDILPALGVSAFGGVPVETDFDDRDSDYVVGARLFFRIPQRAEVGVSFLKEDNDGSSYREEVGVDLWALPLKWLEVQGHSFWNNRTDGWMEHSYVINVFPIDKLNFSTLVSHTSYDDAFFPTRLPGAFSPDILGSGEDLTKIAPLLEYQLTDWLSGIAEYTHYEYDKQGSADAFGVTFKAYVSSQDLAAGASIHRVDGDTKRLRYLKARIYATKTFEALEASLDTVILNYDESFSGVNTAYSISGTLAYKFTASLLASASLYYSENPDFDHEVRAFLKIVYNFGKEI